MTHAVGTVSLEDKQWRIECSPHILLRIKRVFERISKAQHGFVTLSDIPENARELLWFLHRYPMACKDRKYLRRRADEHKAREAAIAAVLRSDYQPPQFELAVPAREYQRTAAELLLRTGGILLADDVGVGKSCSAICTLTDPRTLPALVVTLTHLPRQWQGEIEKFAPSLKTHILKTGKPYNIDKGGPPDVIISNYHKLSGWSDTLAPRIRSVVYDECQELRHQGSNKYFAARHLSTHAKFRMGLSATPIYNYGDEIFNVMDLLSPGTLGTHGEFAREWGGGHGLHDPKLFGAYAREQGLMLRRTRADVGRELPPLTIVPHWIDADLDAIGKVQGTAEELARIILSQQGMEKGAKWRAAEELSWLLRQATGIAKAPFAAQFVEMLCESGEQVLLYGWHREVYEIWRERLAHLRPVFYTGTESPTQKLESKRQFLNGHSRVLVMSLRAGAGLDGLQAVCRNVVIGELDWSPGVLEQCIGRVDRDGQSVGVMAYYLYTDHGSDPTMLDVLGVKKPQIQGLRDPDAALIQSLEIDPGHVRRLAEEFLRQRGVDVRQTEATL